MATANVMLVATAYCGSPLREQAYIKAAHTDPDDQFGRSTAADGNLFVIGAPGEASISNKIDHLSSQCAACIKAAAVMGMEFPAVVLAALGLDGMKTTAEREALLREKNIVDFIQKPFDINDLVKRVKKLTGA